MKRRQLSLFISGPAAESIERARQLLDPVQSALIPAHVTLCREDEIEGIGVELIASRVAGSKPIHLSFGRAEAFSGHGILLNCVEGESSFAQLREQVLGTAEIRGARAHITLAHPRNPRAIGNSPDAANLDIAIDVTFDRVVLIEQECAGASWTILREFSFATAAALPNQTVQRGRAPRDPARLLHMPLS